MPKSASRPPPPFAHQIQSTKFFLKSPIGLDTSDPGTGKTRVQIDTYAARRNRHPGAALIIAPKSLLQAAWAEDFKKFAPHLHLSVAHATNRERAFAQNADVYITNTDAVRWLAKQKPSFFKKFSTLIIDEFSAFKHRSSQRSASLAKIRKHFEYCYGLTGTPTSNSITDIWHQIFLLDRGQRLGKSFFQFRAAVCTPTQVGPQANMIKWTDKEGAELSVSSLIQDIVVRHKFEDCIDIPKNHVFTVPYELSPKQRKAYAQMEAVAVAELDNNVFIDTVNAAGVTNKLLQIASGAAYADTADAVGLRGQVAKSLGYAITSTDRYELVAELAAQRQHSVVFFNWKHQRDLLLQEFSKQGLTVVTIDGTTSDADRAQAVKDYQAGFYRVLLAHPQSAAHGLTLTRGTATIWASPTYNLEHFLQGNKRIYRAGQTKKTETIMVVAKDTIEELVSKKLSLKDARQTNVLNLLQEYFNT